jgi:hypothetical protein
MGTKLDKKRSYIKKMSNFVGFVRTRAYKNSKIT